MKKIFVVLGCAMLLLNACGKEEEKTPSTNPTAENVKSVVTDKQENKDKVTEDDEFIRKTVQNTQEFMTEFNKFTEPQKYYFCASFAMYGLWKVKPVTASAMVNYFMGLGVAKYNVGINDETFEAFRFGRNACHHEALSDYIIQQKICENIINDAADFANKQNYKTSDLDKRGKIEAERVLQYIKKKN